MQVYHRIIPLINYGEVLSHLFYLPRQIIREMIEAMLFCDANDRLNSFFYYMMRRR